MSAPGLLIIEPASSGVGLVREASELGFRVAVASHDEGDRELPPEVHRWIDDLIEVDTNDEAALTSRVTGYAAANPVSAVIPGFEFYVPIAAHLGRRLGLPAMTGAAALACRDKLVMRWAVASAGLRVPRFSVATDEAGLAGAARHTGFPCVLKPTDSAGSIHVSRADDLPALQAAYRRLVSDRRLDFGRRLTGKVLVEEYIGGREVSVEGLVTGSGVHVLAVTTKLLGPEPYFVELGHIVQSDLPPGDRRRVEAYATAVVRALGLSLGPFHCELRIDGAGPVLIELGARLAGDHIVDLVEITTGISLPRQMVRAYAGLDADLPLARPGARARYAGIRFFTAPGLSCYRSVRRDEGELGQPWVIDVTVPGDGGGQLPPAGDFRCRLGHALFVADSYGQAEQRWHGLGEAVRFAA